MTAVLGAAGGAANAQSLLNAPSAIGLAATQPGRFAKKDTKPKLGMSMWFSVTIADANLVADGDQVLGDWSSCSGLNIKFNTEPLDEGGDYDSPWHMPTKITYGEVTLERAIDKDNAGKIELWLRQVATAWMKGDAGGSKEIARSSSTGHAQMTSNVSTTVQINLHSSMIGKTPGDNLVHSWTLRDAIPVAYTAPKLSSKNNDVAVETLVIAHRGIESIVKAASYSPAARETSTTGALTLSRAAKPDDGSVTFPFNPKGVQLQKTVNFAKADMVGQPLELQLTDAGALGVTISGLRLEGVKEVEKVEQLMSWIDPLPAEAKKATQPPKIAAHRPGWTPARKPNSKEAAAETKAANGKPKPLQLKLGSGGLHFTVLLKGVTAKYTRFTKTGIASRADVDLQLQVHEPPPHKTNPTSGGRPGRTIHTTTAGDTLAGIATATYGTPSAWRDIAEANGIDDPMRLRPGGTLHLDGP